MDNYCLIDLSIKSPLCLFYLGYVVIFLIWFGGLLILFILILLIPLLLLKLFNSLS